MKQAAKQVKGEYIMTSGDIPYYVHIEMNGDYVTVTKYPHGEILLSGTPNQTTFDPRGIQRPRYKMTITIEALQ